MVTERHTRTDLVRETDHLFKKESTRKLDLVFLIFLIKEFPRIRDFEPYRKIEKTEGRVYNTEEDFIDFYYFLLFTLYIFRNSRDTNVEYKNFRYTENFLLYTYFTRLLETSLILWLRPSWDSLVCLFLGFCCRSYKVGLVLKCFLVI